MGCKLFVLYESSLSTEVHASPQCAVYTFSINLNWPATLMAQTVKESKLNPRKTNDSITIHEEVLTQFTRSY